MKRTWLRGLALRVQESLTEQRYFYLAMGERGVSGVVIEYDELEDAPPPQLSTTLLVLWSNVRTEYLVWAPESEGEHRSLRIVTLGVTSSDGVREVKLADYGSTCCRFSVRNPEPPALMSDALVHLWGVVRRDPPPVPASRCQAQAEGKR